MINLSRFDLISLRLFVAVVDSGTLTAGAERFGISLAAASRRIAELEHHCALPLLMRSRHGVTATTAGQSLHRHALDLIAQLERLALAVNDMQVGAGGHLRLWANPSAFGGFLPDLLAEYVRLNPEVRIDLEDSMSEDAVRAVFAGTAELAVIGENTPCEGLETLVCDIDQLVLMTPRGHPLAGSEAVAFERALDFDFVTLGLTASLTRRIGSAAEATGRILSIRIRARSFDAIARIVAAGIGVTILPRAATSLYSSALGLPVMALQGVDMQRRLMLAMRKRDALSAAALMLVELVEARMQTIQATAA